MDIIDIQYRFRLGRHNQEVFDLQLNPQTLEIINRPCGDLPAWTRLDFHQCPHCPLSTSTDPDCPVAVSLVDVVKRFDTVLSYDEIDVEVITAARRAFAHTSAQKGISSLIGLLLPCSGCPHTAFLKPMVRFHLPFAAEEATAFRAAGMYLLAQYFLIKQGQAGDYDLRGLKQIYNNLHLLNTNVAERIRSATRTDSSVNAVILLDVFTHFLQFEIEDHLKVLRHLFAPYFSDFYKQILQST
jgi:hypothetical protein